MVISKKTIIFQGFRGQGSKKIFGPTRPVGQVV